MKAIFAMLAEFLVGEFFAKRIGWLVFLVCLMVAAETFRARFTTTMPGGIPTFLVMGAAHALGFLWPALAREWREASRQARINFMSRSHGKNRRP